MSLGKIRKVIRAPGTSSPESKTPAVEMEWRGGVTEE